MGEFLSSSRRPCLFLWSAFFLVISLQVKSSEAVHRFRTCYATDAPNDPRHEFKKDCAEMCGGTCIQPELYDPASGDTADDLFCECPSDCPAPEPTEEEAALNATKTTKCSQLCGKALRPTYELCVPEDKEFKDAQCVCSPIQKPSVRRYCKKRYRKACNNICREPSTCYWPLNKIPYCACGTKDPSKNGDQFNCVTQAPKSFHWRTVRQCTKKCQSQAKTTFFCERIAVPGQRAPTPRSVCACGVTTQSEDTRAASSANTNAGESPVVSAPENSANEATSV